MGEMQRHRLGEILVGVGERVGGDMGAHAPRATWSAEQAEAVREGMAVFVTQDEAETGATAAEPVEHIEIERWHGDAADDPAMACTRPEEAVGTGQQIVEAVALFDVDTVDEIVETDRAQFPLHIG